MVETVNLINTFLELLFSSIVDLDTCTKLEINKLITCIPETHIKNLPKKQAILKNNYKLMDREASCISSKTA